MQGAMRAYYLKDFSDAWPMKTSRAGGAAMPSPMKTPCRGCGRRFAHLGRHLGAPSNAACQERYFTRYDSDDDFAMCEEISASEGTWDCHYQRCLDKVVFGDFANLIFKDMLGPAQMERVRDAMTRCTDFAIGSVADELSELIPDDRVKSQVLDLMRKKFAFFKNLSTEKMVIRHALTHLPVIRVAENVFGTEKHHRSYGVMIIDWIIFLMKHRRELRRRMYARSEVWKSGAKLTRPANYTIADFDDGTVFPQHPFAQPMVDKPGQPIEVRVALMKGTDDLELNNPLGVARGTEKQACTYGCVGNLAPEERFAHENMCIMLMCPQKVIAELA